MMDSAVECEATLVVCQKIAVENMWETCNHVCSLSKEVGEDNSVQQCVDPFLLLH
uniref:Uncharacterized protein n=1 Tax=Helianthus annuus TaxID=4232 RepID=A0A251SVV9_HELAN